MRCPECADSLGKLRVGREFTTKAAGTKFTLYTIPENAMYSVHHHSSCSSSFLPRILTPCIAGLGLTPSDMNWFHKQLVILDIPRRVWPCFRTVLHTRLAKRLRYCRIRQYKLHHPSLPPAYPVIASSHTAISHLASHRWD